MPNDHANRLGRVFCIPAFFFELTLHDSNQLAQFSCRKLRKHAAGILAKQVIAERFNALLVRARPWLPRTKLACTCATFSHQLQLEFRGLGSNSSCFFVGFLLAFLHFAMADVVVGCDGYEGGGRD
jgi:hypothetical protein